MDEEDSNNITKDLKTVITSLFNSFHEELFSKTEDQLEEYWFFEWDDDKSMDQNLYIFYELLTLYGNNCRKWEEHHHGHICVVERVRDKYIMPKISELVKKLNP